MPFFVLYHKKHMGYHMYLCHMYLSIYGVRIDLELQHMGQAEKGISNMPKTARIAHILPLTLAVCSVSDVGWHRSVVIVALEGGLESRWDSRKRLRFSIHVTVKIVSGLPCKIYNRVMEHTRFILLTTNTSVLELCPRGWRQ